MREIEFRAWIPESKQMGEVAMLGRDFISLEPLGSWDRDNIILMQYIGLQDKNGKEIYEGDIVRTYHKLFTVAWSDTFYGFALVTKSHGASESMTFPNFRHYDWEVIGNIYENPEMLETKE